MVNRFWMCSFAAASLLLSLTRPSLADDAYDDDEETDRPEEGDFGEDPSELRDRGLRSGGLQAPDALGEPGDQRTDIEKELQESDERDSGRGLEFAWLTADVGVQYLSLGAFSADDEITSSGETSGAGLVFGGGAGVRILYFTLGARFRYADLSALSHWTLMGEAGLRVPLGKFEPYALIGAGYGSSRMSAGATARLAGAVLRLGGGADYYFSDSFSAGAQFGGDALFLSGSPGRAAGVGVLSMLLLGLHFG